MNLRRINIICWIGSGLLAAGAILAVAAAIWMPYDVASDTQSAAPTIAPVAPVRKAKLLTMQDFEPYLASALRQPIATSQPTTVATVDDRPEPTETSSNQATGLQLVGTVTEANNNYAVFETSDGVEVKHAGEAVAGARVVSISAGVVVMKNPDGQSVTLRVPIPPG